MKKIELSKYFEIVNPTYIFVKLTPLKSLRNYNSDKIINAVASIYRDMTQRIIRDNKKYFFTRQVKLSYYIYMEKEKAEFYFVLPTDYKTLLKDKISDTWRGVTVEEVDSIPLLDNSVKYTMNYAKEDALSLATDKRNNTLLSSIMSTMNVLEQGDKIGVVYNFMPTEQRSWRAEFDYTMKKYKDGFPIDKNRTNSIFVLKYAFKIFSSIFDIVFETVGSFMGEKIKSEPLSVNNFELTSETFRKRDNKIISTQIVVLSESSNTRNAVNNAVSVCESFKSITGDNELKYHRFTNNKMAISDFKYQGAEVIKTTPLESQNFISLPAKELIEEHKLECINTFESIVPTTLQQGVINLGVSIYRGAMSNVYSCSDKELRNLALCITGANRSGKTTLIANIIDNLLTNHECVILPDFCGNCELSQYLKKIFPSKVLDIDCSDFNNLQGMGYNEINKNETNAFKQYRNAKMQCVQLMTLVNAVNEEDKMLKAKMDRYLEAASLVVFISNGSIRDVLNVLQNHVTRAEFIKKIPINQRDNLKEYVDSLNELDEKKDSVLVGTKFNNIAGIIDRIAVLKKNTYIELMLKKSCDNNFNLLDELQKSQIICIRMPEEMFSTSIEKDIFCTYWFSKLWLALQLRKNDTDREKHIKVNIIVDELYQVPKCQDLIASKLSQMPKFTAKLIVSCHYLNQIPVLKNELKASNASYMILQGSNVSNFHELKTEFGNLGFAVEDLLNLKRYNSLNLLSYENGYWAGVTALPKPKQKFTT